MGPCGRKYRAVGKHAGLSLGRGECASGDMNGWVVCPWEVAMNVAQVLLHCHLPSPPQELPLLGGVMDDQAGPAARVRGLAGPGPNASGEERRCVGGHCRVKQMGKLRLGELK